MNDLIKGLIIKPLRQNIMVPFLLKRPEAVSGSAVLVVKVTPFGGCASLDLDNPNSRAYRLIRSFKRKYTLKECKMKTPIIS
jgi:hypothetical protein